MRATVETNCFAFDGDRCIAEGPLSFVAAELLDRVSAARLPNVLIFDGSDSRLVELDLRGSRAEILQRLPQPEPPAASEEPAAAPKKRGRPKLGVVAREVTLLPRHWEWLARQPGGASVALRRLVEQARKAGEQGERARRAQESCYRFMSAMAGDRPHFEEAVRALFAGEGALFSAEIAGWPEDIRQHCERLAQDAFINPRSAAQQRVDQGKE